MTYIGDEHTVHGNVWEWCLDSVSDARGNVERGGSFNYPSVYARSACRVFNRSSFRVGNLGLRPARLLGD